MHAQAFAGQATCILDAQGRFLNVSPSLAAYFHCDGHDLHGQSLLARLEGGDQVRQLLPLLEPRTFQVRLQGPLGLHWATLRLCPGGRGTAGPLVVACFEPPS